MFSPTLYFSIIGPILYHLYNIQFISKLKGLSARRISSSRFSSRMNGRGCFCNLTSKHLVHLIDSRFLFAKKTLLIDLCSSYRNTNCVIRPSGTRKGRTCIFHTARETRKMRKRVRASFAPLSFRNGSGSTFRAHGPCDFR